MLSFASFFNDIASEATGRLIPLFLSQVLGASLPIIGLIEGIAQSTATLLRPVSGWLSDQLPRRKPLVVAGYGLSALTKIFLLFANHWGWILFIRFADRVGKGIRTAPRDAMIADDAHVNSRGKSFGINQMLDTMGAVFGLSLAAYALQASSALSTTAFRTVVLLTLIPSALAVAMVAFGVREKRGEKPHAASAPHGLEKFRLQDLGVLPPTFWRYMALVVLFTLANSSDAFLVLKASNTLHANLGTILLCLVGMNITSTVIALPAGHMSDVWGRKRVIAAGWVVYAISYAAFGLASSMYTFFAAFVFYGAFYGLTESAEKAFVADLVGARQGRGLAYGIFAMAVGIMSLPASLGFGYMMRACGPTNSFLIAAGLAAFSAVALMVLIPARQAT